jgi:hypothetical protein
MTYETSVDTKSILSISVIFRKMFQFPYTNHIGTCCTALGNAKQYSSDQFLVALIGMQRLACHSYTVIPSGDVDSPGPTEFSASLYMAMSSIRRELESLKNELHQQLQDHCKVLP